MVDGDALRVEQVIWNLLNNAVKFTGPHGHVRISTRTTGDEAEVTITDTGQGIDPKFLPHIWEMFRQADASSSRRHGGMGIGLALVSQLVELHGGSVGVKSEGVGKGAEFTFRLPLAKQLPLQSDASIATESGSLNHLRMLVVDDSEDTVEMLRRLLEMDGAIVQTAGSGADALEIARANEFDVIFSDISMPGMDGFEFIKRLRSLPERQHVPVLALTGFGRAEDVERAKQEGFFSHVTKPINVEELIDIVRRLPSRAS
jgi:two-component system CheB/CheR fusion protein